jgi:pSer/pThr/pTyr-binding forkhead associated (FHA) protein
MNKFHENISLPPCPTDSSRIPRSPSQSKSLFNTTPGLSPTFYIFSKKRKTNFRIPADEQVFKIGRGENCDIVIDDQSVSNEQVAIVKLGNYCYFMDCGAEDCVSFDGVKKRQVAVSAASRLILKVGNTWIIYIGINSNDYEDERDTFVLKRSLIMGKKLDTNAQSELLLQSKFGETSTDAAPILVGSHKACDYKIETPAIAPFHFFIYFNQHGAYIEDLTHGNPRIKVDGLTCLGAKPIHEDLSITVNQDTIHLYVYGNIKDRCDHLFSQLQTQPNLVLTALNAPNAEPILLPKVDQQITIGRDDSCDIFIDDPSISRLHAYMQVKDKCLYLADNHSANKSYVNTSPIEKAKVQPGDILEFGHVCFLLHYAS